jgi:secreted trypsin-like serine protease
LFAAHCLQDKKQTWTRQASESYFFFKNDYNDLDESVQFKVSEFIVHPDWDPEDTHYDADIAIAVLEEPIELSNEIRHVCLNTPTNPIQSLAARNASVYDWGLTEDLEFVSQLRHVDVPLVDQALCNSSNPKLAKIMSDTSFCAGARNGKTGACNGEYQKRRKPSLGD